MTVLKPTSGIQRKLEEDGKAEGEGPENSQVARSSLDFRRRCSAEAKEQRQKKKAAKGKNQAAEEDLV